MAKISVTKQFRFSMGHALWLYDGKCFDLHGHNYLAEITVTASDGLDEIGFVMDFSDLKEAIGTQIDELLDHKTLINKDDPRFNDKLPGVVKVEWNPTAENIAAFLFTQTVEELKEDYPNVTVTKVTLWETDTAKAEVTR
jgi:6-pyruvoyltetrahydropterin/6-carboxytetrahydropterin synthase